MNILQQAFFKGYMDKMAQVPPQGWSPGTQYQVPSPVSPPAVSQQDRSGFLGQLQNIYKQYSQQQQTSPQITPEQFQKMTPNFSSLMGMLPRAMQSPLYRSR